jgi:hypothetical protein
MRRLLNTERAHRKSMHDEPADIMVNYPFVF